MDKLYSADFQHPETAVPCVFAFDIVEELISLEPCDTLCDQWGINKNGSEYQETEALCAGWGKHRCSSAKEANRIIKKSFPDAWDDGVYFTEEEDD